MKVSKNKFVSATYDLYVSDENEEVLMESATSKNPLQFIFGTETMLPAFEDNIKGLEKGSEFNFTLTPENAYGEYVEENLIKLPKNVFEVDGVFDKDYVKEGATLPMMSSDGERINGSVIEIGEDEVTMDFNHPLAGETLNFRGVIVDVHDPTEEEIASINKAMSGGCCSGGCDECEGCDNDNECDNEQGCCSDDNSGKHKHGNCGCD